MRLALLVALALTGCSAAPARRDARAAHPEPVEGPAIVSLNPCTDAILAEVADPSQILAISAYSHDPASSSMELALAHRFMAVGGSVEEVLALRPGVVVGGTFMSPATVGAFHRLGQRLEQLGMATTIEESEAQIRRLAAIAGHPERGEALVRRIEAALAKAASSGAPIPAIVWQSGGIVPGEGTLISDLLRRTGFRNEAAARGMQQADIMPLEQMLAAPPRVILAAGDPQANVDRLLSHPALARLKGVAQERLDPSLLWCGGPTIIKVANRLREVRRSI